jgi:DNA-binding Lrp family transcriptional regulator
MHSEQDASNKEKIDVLDIYIIKELLANSRKSLTEIAEKCKVSKLTIHNRVDLLRKKGIIRGSSVIVDFAFFEAEGLGALFVNVNPRLFNAFLKDIRSTSWPFSFPVIQKFNKNINIIIVCLIRNFQELQDLKDSIKQHSAVKTQKTSRTLLTQNLGDTMYALMRVLSRRKSR